MPISLAERFEDYIELLHTRLPGKSLRHYISTAKFMANNTEKMCITLNQATNAGLLHDLCKVMSNADLLEAARGYGIDLNEVQIANPMLLHGAVAAEECRRDHGIDDDTYEAIYWHTTGHPKLGKIGLALYFADYAEPTRDFLEAKHARKLLELESFDKALRYVVQQKRDYILRYKDVDPSTEEFYQWVQTVEAF